MKITDMQEYRLGKKAKHKTIKRAHILLNHQELQLIYKVLKNYPIKHKRANYNRKRSMMRELHSAIKITK